MRPSRTRKLRRAFLHGGISVFGLAVAIGEPEASAQVPESTQPVPSGPPKQIHVGHRVGRTSVKPRSVHEALQPPPNQAESLQVVGSRSRPLQHSSLPSTVFDKRDIERAGISTPQDLIQLTPGVSLVEGNEPSNSQITVRGVSQTYSLTADPPVSVIVDGVPQTSPSDFNQELLDLQDIEVVKGPQNAIYGRNAVAGAVVINTQLPPAQREGSISGTATNGNGVDGTLKLAGPIIPNLVSGSIVANETELGGYYKDVTTGKYIDGQNNQAVHGRLYITPTDDLAIDLKSSWTQMQGNGLAYHAQYSGSPYYVGRVPDVNNTSEPYVADLPNLARTLKNDDSMRIDWTVPFGKISSVSSYSFNKDQDYGALFPYQPSPIGTADGTQSSEYTNNSYFQELKFISNRFDRVRFQTGADYYDFVRRAQTLTGVTYDRVQYEGIGPYGPDTENPTTAFADDLYHTKAWELFGEATYDITRKLSIDGAIRYTRNDITDRNLTPAAFTDNLGEIRSLAFSKAEPRVTLTYKVTPDTSVYADWAIGSLPGGFNPTGSGSIIKAIYPTAVVGDTYKQESSHDWEIGFNTEWLQHRLTLNGALYYDIMYNQQYNIYYPSASIEVIDTIDKVHNVGAELGAYYTPAPGWRISATAGLLHSVIEAFAADPTAVSNRPPYSPEYTLSFAIDREVKLNERWTGFGRFEDDVKGTEYWEADNLPGARSNVINLADIRVGVRSRDWTIEGFVKNLADNRYNISNVVLTAGVVATYLAPPRVFGGQVTYNF